MQSEKRNLVNMQNWRLRSGLIGSCLSFIFGAVFSISVLILSILRLQATNEGKTISLLGKPVQPKDASLDAITILFAFALIIGLLCTVIKDLKRPYFYRRDDVFSAQLHLMPKQRLTVGPITKLGEQFLLVRLSWTPPKEMIPVIKSFKINNPSIPVAIYHVRFRGVGKGHEKIIEERILKSQFASSERSGSSESEYAKQRDIFFAAPRFEKYYVDIEISEAIYKKEIIDQPLELAVEIQALHWRIPRIYDENCQSFSKAEIQQNEWANEKF